jgi:hypothetical protein
MLGVVKADLKEYEVRRVNLPKRPGHLKEAFPENARPAPAGQGHPLRAPEDHVDKSELEERCKDEEGADKDPDVDKLDVGDS